MAQYAPMQASPEWHPSLSNQHRGNILNHSKRKAEDDLEPQSTISSQFKKLRLQQTQTPHQVQNHVTFTSNTSSSQAQPPDPAAQHHYPVPAAPSPPIQHSQPSSPTILYRPHIANTDARPGIVAAAENVHPTQTSMSLDSTIARHDFALHPNHTSNIYHDPMPLDDNPNRVVISDLCHEIAEIEAEEALSQQQQHAHLILPEDIDKKVSAVPAHLLRQHHTQNQHQAYLSQHTQHQHHLSLPHHHSTPSHAPNTALILYKIPSSISIPAEEDVVRKTIIEARRRAREKTAEEQRERALREREAETRALEHHWDDGMVDHSFQHHDQEGERNGLEDEEQEEMGEDEGLDPMDIE